MNTESAWRPATPGERYPAIDIIRGLALSGVLLVNLLTVFRIPLLEHVLRLDAHPGWADRLVDLFVACVLEAKALTIFSFLFGVSVGIQWERATLWNINARNFLFRRLGWLFLIGTVHLFGVWNGDILALYAVCGLVLAAFSRLPWPALFVIGAIANAIPEFVSFGPPLPSGQAARDLIAQARQVYATAGFLTILEFRWHETWTLIVPLLAGILPRTIGLMCWGVAAWRSGILREPGRHKGKLTLAFAGAGALGVVATASGAWAGSSGGFPWQEFSSVSFAAPILLSLAYVSGLLLWLTPVRAATLPGLEAAGRMALTNYLLQSIVLGIVFYGYGLGLFGRIGSAAAACLGLALYAAQLQLSRFWLRRFRFGPFEWLWRSLTYWRLQPMRLGASSRADDSSRG